MEATSVAIWKRNIAAVGIAAIIWINNCAFFIQGKSPSSDFGQSGALIQSGLVSGILRVNKKHLYSAFCADLSDSFIIWTHASRSPPARTPK
jgi:hypothetical protein